MRKMPAARITAAVARLWAEANFELGGDVLRALRRGLRQETKPLAKKVFRQILANAAIARRDRIPLCQDTGRAIVLAEVGREVVITGPRSSDQSATLRWAIDRGVALATKKYSLRASTVDCPRRRANTADNTPAIVQEKIVPGNKIRLTVLAKGGGAENASVCLTLNPTATDREIVATVLEIVKEKGPNACPPLILGLGLGGTFDQAPQLAKKALFRPLGRPSRDPLLAALEKKILSAVNKTGIGPAAFGGRATALAVHLEVAPCHLASLPLAVNFDCHVHRLKRAVL